MPSPPPRRPNPSRIRPMHKAETLKNFLQGQKQLFSGQGVESPSLSAELLLARALGLERPALLKRLIMEPCAEISPEDLKKFNGMAARRLNGEPVAYILGEKEFYGRTFKVTPATLVPRPETELVIDSAKNYFSGQNSGSFADLGTGSGCIAVTLALELGSGWQGAALDKSAGALAVAKENAAALGAYKRLSFIEAEFKEFSPAPGSIDLLASNPPYVSEAEHMTLEKGVRDFEPKSALVPGGRENSGGLEDLLQIAAIAETALKSGGILIMEMGCSQGCAMRETLGSSSAWQSVDIIKDLAGLDRLVLARLR